jgi:hypothetical protein
MPPHQEGADVAKPTVYVPDDLWEQAGKVAQQRGMNASQFIQSVLREKVGDDRWSGFGDDALFSTLRFDDRAEKIANRMHSEALDIYNQGYGVGLNLAENWPFWVVDALHENGFDVTSLDPMGSKWDGVRTEVEQALDEFDGAPSSVFMGGLSNALRDLYDRVYEGGLEAGGPAPDGTNEEQKDG